MNTSSSYSNFNNCKIAPLRDKLRACLSYTCIFMFSRNQMRLFKSALKNKFTLFDICRFRLTKQFKHFCKVSFEIFQNSNLLCNILS